MGIAARRNCIRQFRFVTIKNCSLFISNLACLHVQGAIARQDNLQSIFIVLLNVHPQRLHRCYSAGCRGSECGRKCSTTVIYDRKSRRGRSFQEEENHKTEEGESCMFVLPSESYDVRRGETMSTMVCFT